MFPMLGRFARSGSVCSSRRSRSWSIWSWPYALVPTACSSRNELPIHLVHLACLLLTLYGLLTAWRCWKAAGATWSGEAGDPLARSRFMAGVGLLVSGMFVLVIVAQWIPSFVLDPCQ